MIVTRDQAAHQARQGVESWALSDAGGLTQIAGAHLGEFLPAFGRHGCNVLVVEVVGNDGFFHLFEKFRGKT